MRRREIGRDEIAAHIRAGYDEMWTALHKMLDWKKAHGICTTGMSCMEPCRPGSVMTCEYHYHRQPRSRKDLGWFSTPYGEIRLKQIETAKEAKRAREEREAAQAARKARTSPKQALSLPSFGASAMRVQRRRKAA